MIINDEALLNEFRAKGHCEWCLRAIRKRGELHANHIFTRGAGGGMRLDIRVNLVAMCWHCHSEYHEGRIKRKELLEIVANREKTTVAEIVAEVYRLRRAPKGAKA